MSNIIGLDTKQDDMKACLERLKRQMPEFAEHAQLIAQIKHAYFSALVKQGFSEAQALHLCSHSMII